MITVWKYEIEPDLVNQVYSLPKGAIILSFGADPMGKLYFWAQVDDKAPTVDHVVSCIGTGWEIASDGRYLNFIGTAIRDDYVWHLFDLGESSQTVEIGN